ncbi:MAG: hypothetical protein DYG96_04450 [Chlorobi bacterium CHB2]|nr:MAG: Lipopolysaccharide synthesis sugar transferase [Chlorobi bacterium OLB7]MCE7933826.1 hypothetical protein [Chlorobi bacterium CHB2]
MQAAVAALPREYDFRVTRIADGISVSPTETLHRPEPIAHLAFQPALTPFQQIAKRAFDLAIAVLLMPIILPLMAIIAIAIKIDSPGPILFRQKRIGEKGKVFGMYKFRSMYHNSDDMLRHYLRENPTAQHQWNTYRKLRQDPRVTTVGNFLRRTSLDELPQLLNVLQGTMSLVGPRPILPREIEDYGHNLPIYELVRPGISGLWQISGRNMLGFHERVMLDMQYIRKQTLWSDCVILVKTLGVVFRRQGAW